MRLEVIPGSRGGKKQFKDYEFPEKYPGVDRNQILDEEDSSSETSNSDENP